MLNLDPIRERVSKGVATPQDVQALMAEVDKLYSDPKPASELAAEAAQAAADAAAASLERAQAATLAAQAEAKAAQERADTARKVSEAAQAAANARNADLKAAADKQAADAILAQKTAVAESLKTQLDA